MKKFFEKVITLFKTLLGKLDIEILEHAEQAIAIGNQLKSFLNGSLSATIVNLIPGDWDNKLAAKATEIINKIMPELLKLEDCTKLSTEAERYLCYVQKIAELSPKMQNAFIFKFASTYLQSLHKNMSESQADSVIQGQFITK